VWNNEGERGRSGSGTGTEEYKENDATFGINGIDRLVVEIDASENVTEEGKLVITDANRL